MKTKLWNRLCCLIVLLATLAACTGAPTPTPTTPPPTATPRATPTPLPPKPVVPYTPVPEGAIAPAVIWRTPQRGETLAPEAGIELVFDQPMARETVSRALTVQTAAEAPTPIAGELTWRDDRTAVFKPGKALPRNVVYDVILTQDATSATGTPLREPLVFRFATAGTLEVAQVIPAPGTTDTETDMPITVMFNRPVAPLTSLKQMESLPNPLRIEPAIEGQGEWLNTSIYVFRPAKPLAGGVTYRVTVASGLQDLSGALLIEDYNWSFSTQPPEVVWTQPRDGETLVDIRRPIQVEFNQPIEAASAQRAFSLKGGSLLRTNISGSFAVMGNTLTFTPTRDLEFDTTYTVSVEAGVTGVSGGEGMRQAYTWQFTTVPLPRIVSTNPKDGERNVPAYSPFQIIFNTRIDPKTVMPNLTVTPPLSPTQVYTYFSEWDNTFTLYFGAQASTDYTVVIGNGIADPYGNTIPRGATVRYRTAPLEPDYRILTPDFVATYDAGLPAQVALAYLNLNRVNLRLYRLPLSALQESYWNWREQLPAGADLLREWTKTLEAPLNKQSYIAIDLTETPGGKLTPGLYLLDVSAPELRANDWLARQQHLLVLSDFNLTLKSGPHEALVWAVDLATGQPTPNLALNFAESFSARSFGQATTDREGIARLSLPADRGSMIVISEQPFAAIAEGWARGINPWDFGMGEGLWEQKVRTYVYTDRPIYRPGQTVNFKGMLRAEDDAAFNLPNFSAVKVSIRDAAWQEIYSERLPVNRLGAFEGALALDANAALGNYVLTVEITDQYYETYFQVAAYRPPEFEIVVTPAVAELRRGESTQATLTARYFFGGPLANTAVTWNVLAERYTFKPPWGGRYSFSDVDDPWICFDCWWRWEPEPPREAILSGSGATDANGELRITLDGAALDAALPYLASRIIIEATAAGPDNQEIAGRSSVVVHPGPYYIGLAPRSNVGVAEKENIIDLVAVDWKGERLANQALKVAFYRREWKNTFIANELGGGRWSWETEDIFVSETTVTTDARGEAVARVTPPKGGSYHVIATPAAPTPATERIRSSVFVWITGKENVSWRRENHDRITLISDKTTYRVGETAEILIPSPFEGRHWALVTVERAGIRRYELVRLETNSAIYRLPIEEGDIPNIYVSVVLVQGRSGAEAQGGKGAVAGFKMGLLPLDVSLEPKTLTLSVEPSTPQAQPGEEVTYTITATSPDGRPAAGAELSLDVVDKAVLSLQPRSSNILSGFYARRMLQINTSSGLSLSANRYLKELAADLGLELGRDEMQRAGAAVGMGGMADGAVPAPAATMMLQEVAKEVEVEMLAADMAFSMEGITVRQEFADTAAWQPTLVTDSDGRARFTLTLPDNLTTWTARAVGHTAATVVGEGTAELVVAKPLMVRPVAPRFFVVEDRAQLAANVSNNTDQPLQVEVALNAEGVGISQETPAVQTVTIPARSERKVTWWVRVTDVPNAQLVFAARAGEYTDASKPRLTTGPDGSLLVLRYTAPDIVGTAGQITEGGSVAEGVALPPQFDDRRGQLTVQLDPSLAAGMQDGLRYLEHFEYECTEQTVSRFLPNLLTYRALKSLGVQDAELEARLPALIDEGLQKLAKQQRPDGGWGWWYDAEKGQSNPHVSAYVVFALLKVRQNNINVDGMMLQRGLEYLKTQLQTIRQVEDTRKANQQAWLLYVLAEAGQAPQDKLDNLFEHRGKLSHYARAYLAQALWLGNRSDARLQTLLADLNNAAILSATGAHWEEANYDWWAMNTDTRSTAIILNTLTKLDPENALNPNIVRWLMVARRAGIWETTQETAWALIALTDWMVMTGELDADYDFGVFLNDGELTTASATRETVRESTKITVPIADLLADALNVLGIARTAGPGRLYYTAHLEVYQPVEALEPADRGFSIQRRYTLASCAAERIKAGGSVLECPEVREVKLGDVIRVDLTIITPHDRYYVVVEDPLPAGGEAVDTGLATTSLLAMEPTLSRPSSRWWWWWNWYSRSELRDEKVVLFADVLSAGTYEYSYTFRATLPGEYRVIPTVAREFYFPEVFGRSDGRLLTIGE